LDVTLPVADLPGRRGRGKDGRHPRRHQRVSRTRDTVGLAYIGDQSWIKNYPRNNAFSIDTASRNKR